MAKVQKRFIGVAALVAVFFLSAAASFAAQGDFTPKTGMRKNGITGLSGCSTYEPDCYLVGLMDRIEFNLYIDSPPASYIRALNYNDPNYFDERDFTTAAKGVEIAYDEIQTHDNKYQHTLGGLDVGDFFYIQLLVDNAANPSESLGLDAKNVLVGVDWSNPRNVIGSIGCTATSVSNPTTDIVTLDLANGSTIKPISEVPILVLTGSGYLPGEYKYLDWDDNAYNNTSQIVNIGTVHPYGGDNLVRVYFPFKVTSPSLQNKVGALPAILSLLSGRKKISSTLNDNVIAVDENSTTDIVASTIGATGETTLRLSGEMANTTQNGSILYMLPGSDGRFPFGFAGRVANTTSNTDGTKTVELQEVSYADVVQEASIDIENITLDASNFVGVIAPSAIQAASPMPMAAMSDVPAEDFYSFRNGAIIVRNDKQESLQYSLAEADSTIDAGTVSLNMKVDLVDMDVDAKRMVPVNANTSIGFVINGSLKNIKLTNKLDFSKFPPAINSADLRIDGDFNFDVKFNGKGDVTFGYFSRAWNEVKDESFKAFGVSAKLLGLSSDDKIGKYPLTGLVFSVPCLALPQKFCRVKLGKTQTPLRQAKVMGVIVWVYLTLEGDIHDIDGDFHPARLNPAKLSLGIKKSPGGDFQLIKSLKRISNSGRLIEAPALNGTLKASLTAGITTDLDFFTSGVRVANAGIDIVARKTITLTGEASYGTDSLDSPWSWDGKLCRSGSIGAGAVFSASAHLGIDIDTSWVDAGGDLDYKFQFPTDEEMDMPGWHGGWYNVVGEEICTVTSATGRVWMDRNLGASRVATSMNDTQAYGDLYQWGRLTDGHEKRTSSITSTLSSTDTPNHDKFIIAPTSPRDWRSPQNNNLWQGVNGKNNPCPTGFRLPTISEWGAEVVKYGYEYNSLFNSPLKLPAAGLRGYADGSLYEGSFGYYWSSTIIENGVRYLGFDQDYGTSAEWITQARSNGFRVRCIKN
ncbi:MAG: hypothetical protein D3914_01315 [Candidatus Electrothrix sp. LOE2]|nr:hypothetical protein [Candidatus Electrothrix sp. LOE2]